MRAKPLNAAAGSPAVADRLKVPKGLGPKLATKKPRGAALGCPGQDS